MLALEIRINGELKATCGAEALDQLVAWISAKRSNSSPAQDFTFRIECLGFQRVDPDTKEVLKWVAAQVQRDDEVSIRFVDATKVHQPIDRQKISSKNDTPDA